MASEKFENRKLTGKVNVACKYDDGTTRFWNTLKEDVVDQITKIVRDYRQQGYVLTLRQLHYQMVTRFPDAYVNHDTAYKKLGTILDDCRYAGIIDWEAIEDRGRVPYIPFYADGVDDALKIIANQYRLDRQKTQTNVVELWTEKDALSGILKKTTQKYHVRLVVNKGYTSSSAAYNAYQRVLNAIREGKTFSILYFGDHDPSGLDMVRDIRERIELMLTSGNFRRELAEKASEWDEEKLRDINFKHQDIERGYTGDGYEDEELHMASLAAKELFQIIPIGLTMSQIKQFNLPPNPTKLTDTRADKYIAKFGKTCWEVDALSPSTLTSLVEKNIKDNIDMGAFEDMIDEEAAGKKTLLSFIETRKK